MKKDNFNLPKKDYFNKLEFRQANYLYKKDPLESALRFEKYFEKYPEDYSSYPYYSSILILLGRFEEAKKILDYVELKYKQDKNYIYKKDKVEFLEKNIVYDRLKILAYEKNYQELYNLYYENYNVLKDIDFRGVLFFCEKKLDILHTDKREYQSYFFKQILEYRESDFFEHIQKHLADYNLNADKPNNSIFVPDFPINKVIEEIKNRIPSEERMHAGFLEDIYIFKYDECGRDNNKLVDFFKVVCFYDTKQIITMCPVSGYENAPCIDLNYMKKNNDIVTKVKRKSQIEKFNKRYKIN